MMMEKLQVKLLFLIIALFAMEPVLNAQTSNRAWWTNLSPAWKQVFYKEQFKGKEIEPNDEVLERVVKMKRINCSNNSEIKNLKPLAKLVLLERLC